MYTVTRNELRYLNYSIPVPSYSPPSVPLNQARQPSATRNGTHRSPEDPSPSSNSIGSPNSTGSPIDTTGSISDSFYINSDVISSTNGSQLQIADDNGYTESEVQSKYQLHRIEEESEIIEERGMRTVFSQGSLDREQNYMIPRSISEQVTTFIFAKLLSSKQVSERSSV
ncbi:unnamed protein product [Strongylus vulgaris]|uniref:Uncharacterized protein n=1 Tax=Strongylus vulgaris TaxID=40348 RepID=A0A3P7KL91_STRVU|nr:unnamed protein product [Strongylus vulgaris]